MTMIPPVVAEICGLWSCTWQGFVQFLISLFVRLFVGNPLSVIALLIFVPIMLLVTVRDLIEKVSDKKESDKERLVSSEEAEMIGRAAWKFAKRIRKKSGSKKL